MADDLDQELRFFFKSAGQGPASLKVVRLEGSEAISQLFRFELILVSNSAEIDFKDMLSNSATLTIRSYEGSKEFPYHGELAEFEQLNKVNEFVFYRAVLVPKVSRLSLNQINEVYLNEKSIPEVIEQVLKVDITNSDFEMVLKDKSAYRKRSFICQHQESNLDFISRWMEFEGMYYFFEHGDADSGTDKLKILDYKQGHPNQSLSLKYCQAEDLQTQFQDQNVTGFICRQKPLPKTVIVQDFNYRQANLENLKATETVSDTGRGEVMFYGDNLRTNEEAKALAKVRAQELQARGQIFLGEATAVGLRSGYFLELTEHYRDSFNAKYLITEVQHFGSQAGAILAGNVTPYNSDGGITNYRASFIAIPAEMQYRAERVTPKPVIAGTMSGVVDGEGSGDYAEINEHGQYKVQLLYDLSDKNDNKGSAWIRMASPYAGSRNGMNFPLLKGAEVLLSFIGGDPDQPVIMSAVPNSENPNVVTSDNQNSSGLLTPSGNRLTFSDEPGQSGYEIYVPGVGVKGYTGGSGSPKRKFQSLSADAADEVVGAVKGYSYTEGYEITVNKGGSSKLSMAMDASGELSMANKLAVGITNEVKFAMDVSAGYGGGVSMSYDTKTDLEPSWSPLHKKRIKEDTHSGDIRAEEFYQITSGTSVNNPINTALQIVEQGLEALIAMAQVINVVCLSLSFVKVGKKADDFGRKDYSATEESNATKEEEGQRSSKMGSNFDPDHISLAQYTSLALSLAAFMYVVMDRFKPKPLTPASALNVSKDGNFLGAIGILNSSYLKQTPDYIELKTGSAFIAPPPLWKLNSNLVGGINHAVANYRAKLKLDGGNLGISATHGVNIDALSFVVNVPPLFPLDPVPPVQNRAIAISSNETALKSGPIGTSSLTLKDAGVELISATSGLEIKPLEFSLATIGSHISGKATKLQLVGPTVEVLAADINLGGSINIKPGLMTVGDITCLGAGAAGVGLFAQAAAQNATIAALNAKVLALQTAQVVTDSAVVTAQSAVNTLKQATEDAIDLLHEGVEILFGQL